MVLTLDDLDTSYVDNIRKYSRKREELDIPNSTLEHALLVQINLFENTERSLSILTGDASEISYPDLQTSLIILARKLRDSPESCKPRSRFFRFFNKSKIQDENPIRKGIRILLSNETADDNKGVYNFFKGYSDIIKIKRFNKPNPETLHFAVSDSIGYRSEEKHSKEDLNEYKINAEANFNNPDTAGMYEKFFDRCWNMDEKLVEIQ